MARQPTSGPRRSRSASSRATSAKAGKTAAAEQAQALEGDVLEAEGDELETASLPTPTTAVQKAVSFNQAQLTAQAGDVLGALENPLADQAAVMMLEDLRGYMQGSEQLVLAASGRAMALLLDPATQSTGQAALQELATWQTSLITFSDAVASTASTIKTDFT
jgi:hypothetical protein